MDTQKWADGEHLWFIELEFNDFECVNDHVVEVTMEIERCKMSGGAQKTM